MTLLLSIQITFIKSRMGRRQIMTTIVYVCSTHQDSQRSRLYGWGLEAVEGGGYAVCRQSCRSRRRRTTTWEEHGFEPVYLSEEEYSRFSYSEPLYEGGDEDGDEDEEVFMVDEELGCGFQVNPVSGRVIFVVDYSYSIDNKIKIPKEKRVSLVLKAIKTWKEEILPAFPAGFTFNCSPYQEDGMGKKRARLYSRLGFALAEEGHMEFTKP
jgi:hypothetical protein